MVSIPACHAGDRGSIPRRGGLCLLLVVGGGWCEKIKMNLNDLECENEGPVAHGGIEPTTFALLARRSNQLS